MKVVAGVVVVAFGVLLISFMSVVLAKPTIAERFLAAFASSARTHYAEQIIRLLVGAALVVFSPAMWHSSIFRLVGWVIVISSAALMCTPWQWHHRFAERVRPTFMRYLRIYAAGAVAFGALLICGVFAGAGAA